MNSRMAIMVTAGVALLGVLPSAMAYVGPGAGLTLVGSFIGLLLALAVALWAVVAWPVRRFLRLRRTARDGKQAERADGMAGTDDERAS